jgi:NADH-quinone oxidoreductase subunit M
VGAALGVILAALYMLTAVQKMFFGPITRDENKHLSDINSRELLAVTPLIIAIFVIGFAPNILLSPMRDAISRTISDMNSRIEASPAPAYYRGPLKLVPRRPDAPKPAAAAANATTTANAAP